MPFVDNHSLDCSSYRNETGPHAVTAVTLSVLFPWLVSSAPGWSERMCTLCTRLCCCMRGMHQSKTTKWLEIYAHFIWFPHQTWWIEIHCPCWLIDSFLVLIHGMRVVVAGLISDISQFSWSFQPHVASTHKPSCWLVIVGIHTLKHRAMGIPMNQAPIGTLLIETAADTACLDPCVSLGGHVAVSSLRFSGGWSGPATAGGEESHPRSESGSTTGGAWLGRGQVSRGRHGIDGIDR